jgi:hypothetical protein
MLTLRQFAPLALASLLIAAAPSRQADTVVLVVRRRRAGPVVTCHLAGWRSACQSLVGVGQDAGISAVLRRSSSAPAGPGAAGESSAQVMDVRGGGRACRSIADAVRARHAGRTVLVVGHSNTVPASVPGGAKYPDICDDVYDDLFTVILAADGSARVVHGKYGAPSPSTTACPAMQ